eukprot:g10492.t1
MISALAIRRLVTALAIGTPGLTTALEIAHDTTTAAAKPDKALASTTKVSALELVHPEGVRGQHAELPQALEHENKSSNDRPRDHNDNENDPIIENGINRGQQTQTAAKIDPSFLIPAPTLASNPFLYFARWLWWLLIAYMFFAQATVCMAGPGGKCLCGQSATQVGPPQPHYVSLYTICLLTIAGPVILCDDWFVPAIEVVCQRYGIPEDVAGATLMALGCNGPELFTNAIALFLTHSDVGVGTIVGSEVFNLLLIVGVSILATPAGCYPLRVDRYPFLRDCFFYMLSIVLLYWVLADQKVTLFESVTLLCFAGVFGFSVGITDRVLVQMGVREAGLKGAPREDIESAAAAEDALSYAPLPDLSSTKVKAAVFRNTGTRPLDGGAINTPPTFHEMHIEAKSMLIEGLVLGASIGGGGDEQGPTPTVEMSRVSTAESLLSQQGGKQGQLAAPLLVEVDSTVVLPPSRVGVAAAKPKRQAIPFAEISRIQLEGPKTISVQLRKLCLTIRAEMACEADVGVVLTKMDPSGKLQSGEGMTNEAEKQDKIRDSGEKPILQRLSAAAAFPIDFCLTATMSWCDPKCPATKSLWLVAFSISMAWLALFSYVMVTVADMINVQFGITQAILGVTLCAAGTSFPNLWASYLTAREGKSSMAVANALGSNVQNVFLALALPWTVKTFFAEGNFIPMATPGIMDGVVWMAMLKGPAGKRATNW